MPTYTWSPGYDSDRVDGKLNRTITEDYYLKTDDTTYKTTQASLKFTADYSLGIGSVHSTQSDCYVSGIESTFDPNSANDMRVFKVTVTYTNNWDSGGTGTNSSGGSAAGATAGQEQGKPPDQREENPLLRGIDVKRSSSGTKVERFWDAAGSAYLNSANDLFQNGLGVGAGTTRYTIERNLAISSATPQYMWFCNASTVVIPIFGDAWAAHCLKLVSHDSVPVYEKGISYFRETYVLESGPNYDHSGNYLGWREEVISRGYRERTLIDGVYVTKPILEEYAPYTPVTEPQFLSSTGAWIKPNSGSALYYITFQPFYTFNMAAIWT